MGYRRLMNWVRQRKCWRCEIDGTVYEYGRRKHGRPITEENSREAANAYMETIIAQHYACKPSPEQQARSVIELCLSTPRTVHFDDSCVGLLDKLQSLDEETRQLVGIAIFGKERYRTLTGKQEIALPSTEPVKQEDAIASVVAAWLKHQEMRIDRPKNGIKLGSYGVYQQNIQVLLDWGKLRSIKDVTEKTVTAYNEHVFASTKSDNSRKKRWETFKCFVKWAYRQKYCEQPRNLEDKELNFGSHKGETQYWTPEEFRKKFQEAEPLGKLILCLAANMGCYGSDMACLEYDGGETLTRGRVKTHRKSPVVTYWLWEETRALLKSHGHLLKDMYRKEMLNGKVKKTDKISVYARRFKHSIKFLRHTSNNALKGSPHAAYMNCFLCDKSRDLKDKVYSEAELPCEASLWLHQWYFAS